MPKIATISQFSNMSDSGIFYLENMVARNSGGKSVLIPAYSTLEVVNNNDTGFTGLETSAMTSFLVGQNNRMMLGGNSGMKFWVYSPLSGFKGLIHTALSTTSPTPDLIFSQFSDLYTTQENNMLWTSRDGLGYMIHGICGSGSGTTKIVDSYGRNFSTMGMGTSSWNNKVYNLNNSEEYTITSISTTSSTNDTLNFAAGTSNDQNDVFVAFADVGVNWDFFATTPHPHFRGQEGASNFKRQIRQFDTDYLIGNGNFLAALNVDETTFNDNFKQLPASTQFLSMGVNQGRVLVGGERYGRGRIMLWDGYSDGWLSIVDLAQKPKAIAAYKTGFVVVIGAAVYFTDGYSLQKVSNLPGRDKTEDAISGGFNSLDVMDDKIIVLTGAANYAKSPAGCYVFEEGKGWTIIPLATNSDTQINYQTSTVGAVKYLQVATSTNAHCSYHAIGTNTYAVAKLNESASSGGRAIFKLEFDEKVNVKQIVLSCKRQDNDINDSITGAPDDIVSVSFGVGSKPLVEATSVKSTGTTTTININGDYGYPAGAVGQLVRVNSGIAGGEYTFITGIADAGTTNEIWTVSPALSSAVTASSEVFHYNLFDCGSYTIGKEEKIPDQLVFDVRDMYDTSFFLDIRMDKQASSLQIERIDIYG